MADLSSFLETANLSHLAASFPDETLASLEARLNDGGRAGFLNHLKAAGVTALKDRQGLTNALGKLKRERENGAPAPVSEVRKFNPKGLRKYEGPNDDCDLVRAALSLSLT